MPWELTGNAGTNPTSDFLGTTDGEPIIVKTFGTERIRVDADGNVGIGTATPNFPLHLSAGKALRIEGGTAAGDTRNYFSFGGNGTFGVDAPGVPNGRFVVLNSGNVGIGTAAPTFPLHMPAGKTLRIEGGTRADDTGNYFSFGGNGTFGVDAPGVPNGRFVVLNSGNVGIGTNNPASKLDVRGGLAVDAVRFPDGTIQTTAQRGGGVLGWALINPDGTVAGATAGTIVQHPATANYNIFFNFNAGIQIQIATLANKNMPGWIAAFGEPELFGPNEVTVQTGNFVLKTVETTNQGLVDIFVPNPADMLFQLIIIEKS